ncbi:enoyl-CoA-hydratase DpgB [Kitasatospora sp. NPDC056181]|uniref:enoyl-CoA-hydratase DpgB n=1 Tax=Kitasatospora sp. NPDC056181 TaxID=3345737 RepID=UPI0035D71534
MSEKTSTVDTTGVRLGPEDISLVVDGARPLTPESVAAVTAVCDTAEDRAGRGRVVLQVGGVPESTWTGELTVSLVSKWERALRRLERLPATTIALADGDCGGTALDAMLAADYRIATASVRLVVPVGDGATWPGMALYRLAQHGASAAAIRRAVLFGTPVEATDALALHLVDELTEDVAGALATVARRAGAVSGTELALRRQLMADAATTSFEEALGVHLAAVDRTLRRAAGAAS